MLKGEILLKGDWKILQFDSVKYLCSLISHFLETCHANCRNIGDGVRMEKSPLHKFNITIHVDTMCLESNKCEKHEIISTIIINNKPN